MIEEYKDKYLEDVKDLLVELEEYILSIDKDNINLILTDELGLNLKKEMEVKIPYFKNFKDAIDLVVKNKKNILLIYRSKYSDLNKR